MRYIKIIAEKIFWKCCEIFLPKKYLNHYFINEFFRSTYLHKLKFREIIWCFFKGFVPKEYLAYDLRHNDYKKYISARNNANQIRYHKDLNQVLFNKILFEKHMQATIRGIDHLHVIENKGYIENGRLKALHKDLKTGDFKSLIPLLEKSDLILKPTNGSRGRGVMLLHKDGDNYILDYKKLNWDGLIYNLTTLNNYLIQEKFVQNGFSHNIYPDALNTMRIATMIDPVTDKPSIAYAVHRFCTKESGYKDNFSQGGICALIDSTGRLGKGLSINSEGERVYHEVHPTSLKPITNEKIQNWENLTNSLVEMAGKMPYHKNIGWDIILSDNELYILEGNLPDLDIIQVFKPAKELTLLWSYFQHNKFFE